MERVESMKLHPLLSELPNYRILGEGNPDIINIENHHRKVGYGDLFVCIQGDQIDSHLLVEDAIKSGAVAIVAERPVHSTVPVVLVPDARKAMVKLTTTLYRNPTKKLTLIGVTGTNGKTTTTHLIDDIYRYHGEKTGLIGTLYMKIGSSKRATPNTTPDPVILQRAFREMVKERVNVAIMEVSSHALTQGRVEGCDFDIAVFTNLSQDHLDFHGSMEKYLKAKSILFQLLGSDRQSAGKFAILNIDDPAFPLLKDKIRVPFYSYGVSPEADVRATEIHLGPRMTSFTIETNEIRRRIEIPLVGMFNVYNALAAVATCFMASIPMSTIIGGLEMAKAIPGRFELIQEDQDFTVIVDYAHTPDSLENVLKTIKPLPHKKIFIIIGCGGDRDRSKRPQMAQIACEYGSDVIFTSDNPRSEDPLLIIKDMEKGVIDQNYSVIINRKKAIEYAINQAQQGDIVLIAGKGHETYQIINQNKIDFDDRKIARSALQKLANRISD
jgi:UDP-N-acetylmuramoyl-L-alanyl-D-glutamate--2,6-diaminopimelate ligase